MAGALTGPDRSGPNQPGRTLTQLRQLSANWDRLRSTEDPGLRRELRRTGDEMVEQWRRLDDMLTSGANLPPDWAAASPAPDPEPGEPGTPLGAAAVAVATALGVLTTAEDAHEAAAAERAAAARRLAQARRTFYDLATLADLERP